MPYRRIRYGSKRQQRKRPSGSTKFVKPVGTHDFGKFAFSDGMKKMIHYVPASPMRATIYGNSSGLIAQGFVANNCYVLNQVAEGPGIDQRVGTRFNMRSLVVRAFLHPPSSWSATFTSRPAVQGTLFLLYDKEPPRASALPGPTVILTENLPTAMQNRDNLNRFEILYRKRLVMSPDMAVWDGTQTVPVGGQSSYRGLEWKFAINRMTEYTAAPSTADFAGQKYGLLFLWFLADDPSADENTNWYLEFHYQLSFVDVI